MLRRHFEEQIEELNTELVDMGTLCEKAIDMAICILFDHKLNLAHEVDALEEAIDRKERTIEDICMRLLLQQQPVAGDLRSISAALKMISDMERIGDQARYIADVSCEMEELSGYTLRGSSSIYLRGMVSAISSMVKCSIDSFVRKDLKLARSVMAQDDGVDDLFNKIKHELSFLITDGVVEGEICIDLLMIAKHLERIGDHAVNIAERVEFFLTGKRHLSSDKPEGLEKALTGGDNA